MCPGADGLYFDCGELVVMGDGRKGGVKGCVLPIKDSHLNSKKPGHPMAQADQQLWKRLGLDYRNRLRVQPSDAQLLE